MVGAFRFVIADQRFAPFAVRKCSRKCNESKTGFGRREQFRTYSLGLSFQVGENDLSRRFVPAPARDFNDELVAVAVADDIRCRFVPDAVGPVLPRRDRAW